MSDGKDKFSYLHPATPNNGPRKLPKVFPFKISACGSVFANANTSTSASSTRNVFLRIKPKVDQQESDSFVALDDNTLAPLAHDDRTAKKVSHRFKFTKIFDSESGQEDIFKETCRVPLTNFMHGGNCLVFAYGATNGGKTFTIQGSKNSPGIIPRAINLLFNSINGKVSEEVKFKPDKINNVLWLNQEDVNKEIEVKQSILSFDKTLNKGCRSVSTLSLLSDESQVSGCVNLSHIPGVCPEFQAMKVNLEDEKVELDSESNNVYSVWVSYAEIYNENIYDLLQVGNTKSRKPLLLGENEQKEVYIKGLTDVCVCSAEEAYKVFLYGKHNIRQAATSVNHVSSRSHSIFSIKLVKHLNIDCPMFAVLSMCTFVDLAGAERAKKTLNAGERMKESQCINTSLHVLGKCLEALRHNQKSKENMCRLLPARESKLTRLFQRALEGKEVFTMIVNINQDKKLFDETLNVLKFSAVAMELQYDRLDNSTICSLRNSRFSQYMEKLSTSNQSSLENIYECPDDSRYMKLLAYTEELKRNLEEEKKKNSTLEIKVRREVYANCRTVMENLEKKYKERLKEERELYAEYEETNVNLFKKYITECYKRKHDSDSEEEEEEDSNDEAEKTACNDKVKFLQSKVEALTALVESAEQVKADHASLQAKYSKLEFELSTVKQDLAKAHKINMTMDLGSDAAGEVLKELQNQLAEQQLKLKEKTKELEDFKKLLEDAKLEYDEHFHEHEDFADRNAELEKIIAQKDETIEDLQSQLNICNKKLTQQQEMVNTREHSEKDMQEKLQSVCEARDEYKFKALQIEGDLKKLQKEYSALKSQPQERWSNNDVRALEALVASHEDQILKYKEKLMSQQEAHKELLEEIAVLKTSSMCSNQDSFEKEISILQQEVKDSVNSKKELLDLIASLQKESKLLNESLKATESALSLEQANTKEMRKICEAEKENLASEVKELKSAVNNLRIQHEKLVAENEKMKLENFDLEETLRVKEEQMDSFKTRRDAQFESYENMLKHERELRERDQREVYQMQTAMRTLTPNKNTHRVEIEKLKDELKEAYMKISELEKGKKPNIHRVKIVKGKKARDENVPQPSEDELEVVMPEVQIKTEPELGRSLRPRRKKVLYSSEDKESASVDFVRPKSSRRHQV